MVIRKLEDYTRGWIIGDFVPSILKTESFEVGIVSYTKGQYWPTHRHNFCNEYNVLLRGLLKINDQIIYPNEIFIINKGEITKPEFLEDCQILCVKVPSIPTDKEILE